MCGCCCKQHKTPTDEKGLLSGPQAARGCTDILMLLTFVLFVCGMIFIAAFSVTRGEPFRLVYGADSFGNTCDEDNTGAGIMGVPMSGRNLKGRPYQLFMDITKPDTSLRICVNKCPDYDIVDDELDQLMQFSQNTGSMLCRYDVPLEEYSVATRASNGPCPVLPIYKSVPLLNYCVPRDLMHIPHWGETNVANNIIAFINKSNVFHKVLRDLYASWAIVTGLCFLAVGFSVTMVILLRYMAAIAVWLVVVGSALASFVGCVFLWWTFLSNKNKLDREESQNFPLLEVDISSEEAFLCLSVAATFLLIVLLVVLLVTLCKGRIHYVITVLREAGNTLSYLPLLLFQPMWTLLLLLVFFSYWVTVLAFLCTAESPNVTTHQKQNYVVYTEHETVTYFWWYHLIGLFWVSEYIISCQSFVTAGVVARWYYTRDKEHIGFPILSNIGCLIMFHQGSVAFGASILTPLKIPRMIVMFLNKRVKLPTLNKCVDKCLRPLASSAYTVMAVSGKNFCSSSSKSNHMLFKNSLRLSAISSASEFVLFLAKLAVMASTTAVGVIWFKSQEDLHFYAIPVLLVSVLSYYIAHCFISVYEMTINALLLCFCEDVSLNDGSQERPYFGSRSFINNYFESFKGLTRVTDTSTRQNGQTMETEMEPAHV